MSMPRHDHFGLPVAGGHALIGHRLPQDVRRQERQEKRMILHLCGPFAHKSARSRMAAAAAPKDLAPKQPVALCCCLTRVQFGAQASDTPPFGFHECAFHVCSRALGPCDVSFLYHGTE